MRKKLKHATCIMMIFVMVFTLLPLQVDALAKEFGGVTVSNGKINYPSAIEVKGNQFKAQGWMQTSTKKIERIEIGFVKNGKWVSNHKVDQKVNAKKYDIAKSASKKLNIKNLGKGTYYYRCWIHIGGKAYKLFDKKFKIISGNTKQNNGVRYSVTLNKGSFYVKNGKTYATTTMEWNWVELPMLRFTDIPAVVAGGDYGAKSWKCKVHYLLVGASGNKAPLDKYVNLDCNTKNARHGVYVNCPMIKTYTYGGHKYKYIAKSGSIVVTWSNGQRVKTIDVGANYGHTTVSMNPKVSFNGLDIAFDKTAKYGEEASIHCEIK